MDERLGFDEACLLSFDDSLQFDPSAYRTVTERRVMNGYGDRIVVEPYRPGGGVCVREARIAVSDVLESLFLPLGEAALRAESLTLPRAALSRT